MLFVTLDSSFAISVKNLILSFAPSRFKSFFKFLILNSTSEIALSIYLFYLSGPYFRINSSGSFAPSICKILTSHPKFLNISRPLMVASCPAPSASYPTITCSLDLRNNLP